MNLRYGVRNKRSRGCSVDAMRDELGGLHCGFPHSLYCVAGTQVGIKGGFRLGVF